MIEERIKKLRDFTKAVDAGARIEFACVAAPLKGVWQEMTHQLIQFNAKGEVVDSTYEFRAVYSEEEAARETRFEKGYHFAIEVIFGTRDPDEVRAKIKSAADLEAATANWDETNQRRGELIALEGQRELSAGENKELQHLQQIADLRIKLLSAGGITTMK